MLFALEECLLPSKLFVQVAFCTFDAIYPFLEGVPSGEVMQDITGAALYSINKVEDNFSFDLQLCRKAIAMIPDPRINSDIDSKCHNISLCMHQDQLPQLSYSLSRLSWEQLIEKSFILHGLEYKLREDYSIENILWKIIQFTHKSRRWKKYKNPNRLFMIIRAYILTLYISHSSKIIPGWYINKFPSAKRSLSFVYVKNEDYTDQSVFINQCAKKLKRWLSAFQPITTPILPNIDTKDEVSKSACFQAGRAGFVSSDQFDFSNMIEEGTVNVDLLNLQLPLILSRSEEEISYIRNHNLRRAPENRRWASYYGAYPYSSSNKIPREFTDKNELNLQSLAQEAKSSPESQFEDDLLDEINDLIRRKKNNEELPSVENVSKSHSQVPQLKNYYSSEEFLAQLKHDNAIQNPHQNKMKISQSPADEIESQCPHSENAEIYSEDEEEYEDYEDEEVN